MKKQWKIIGMTISAVVFCASSIVYLKKEVSLIMNTETVVINEVCHNFSVIEDESGEYENYIEIFNNTGETFDLTGCYLSDSREGNERLYIDKQEIGKKEFLLVYVRDKEFEIKNGTETLYLFNGQEEMLDKISLPYLKYNTSYARENDGEWNWQLQEPTPNMSNELAVELIPETMKEPVLSVESGFYEEEFMLTMHSESRGEIYYTLDGSDPSIEDYLYTEPLLISDASKNPNRYAARTDFTTEAGYEEMEYEVPEELIDKAVIVKAVVYDKEKKHKSKVVTKSYFIGFQEKGYSAFPIMSVVSDPQNLFDYEKGIYIVGKSGDKFLEEGGDSNNWVGNYSNRGRKWEKPAHIDYFDGQRRLSLSQEVGIRIKGSRSRGFMPKSLMLRAREEYSNKDEFEQLFFEDKGHSRVALFSGANDNITKVRDVLIRNICKELDYTTMEHKPCYVFLDGEYWGIYYITECYSEEYIEENYNVPQEDVIMIKNGALECGSEEGWKAYEELNQFIEESDFSEQAQYEELCEKIDIESYMDYYGTMIYISRKADWPVNNEALWRSGAITDKPYQDGKWRWMMFDLNYRSGGMAAKYIDFDSYEFVRSESILFDKLMENETFRKEFLINFCDIKNSCFASDVVLPELQYLCAEMKNPMLQELKRFYNNALTEMDFDADAADLYQFFEKRPEYIIERTKEEFELEGTYETLRILNENSEGGYIVVNDKITIQRELWEGGYFTDYPISVKAVPEEGYRFVGWQGDVLSQDEEICVSIVESGKILKANFVEE